MPGRGPGVLDKLTLRRCSFCMIGDRLCRAFVTANCDLFSRDRDLYSAVFDLPIADRAFRCSHFFVLHFLIYENVFRFHVSRIREAKNSGYQILAHFADGIFRLLLTNGRGRFAEFTPENICEMAMARKSQIECDIGNFKVRISDPLKRRTQPQHRQITMDRQPRLLLKDACEVKWRSVYRTSNVIERHGF